ncbi:POTRA domain-containing protein [Pontibacter ruber]|uniref:POTRA domain-containing protein n=1 Tax=Pontibacter ruber TaxID=1343895 RepID=A0ABW5D1N3_9BACT|nr:POTRA domain-containing protein [Pontibacter ruber]
MLLRVILLLLLLLPAFQEAAGAAVCPSDTVVIAEIRFQGNETTKSSVLQKELTFATGDTLVTASLVELLEENRKRLFNLRLFHNVTYTYTCQEGQVSVLYTMQERWYLYPFPIFSLADRNFNAWWDKKDYDRIDYGINLVRRNFRGRNEEVRIKLQHGFNRRVEFAYRVPYVSRSHRIGFDFGIADYRSHTIDVITRNNRQRFFEQEEGMPVKRMAVSAALVHRQNVQRQQGFRLSFHQEEVSDSVLVFNPEYFRSDVQKREFVRFELFKAINLRNNFAYPLTGSYFEVAVGQTMFLNNAGAHFTTARAKYVDYRKLSNKYYYTVGGEGQLRLSRRYAYADNVALGFRSMVRGYELYVIGGQHFGLFKQGLSRELINLKGIHLKPIKSSKFNTIPLALYLNAFTDAGYVVDQEFEENNPLTNRLLLGGGLGLHAVTFYDIVVRAEYTINREGDRGIYLSGRFPF